MDQVRPETSKLIFPKDWVRIALCGMCMGAADIVPGISGGTIAFIIGIYQDLLNSIKSFDIRAFYLLLCLRFREFNSKVSWEFLTALIAGILFSFLTLAQFFNFLLGHEVYRVYLYSAFLGLILASVVFCAKQLNRWNFAHFFALLAGAAVAYVLTGTILHPLNSEALFHIPDAHVKSGFNLWIICCGAIAISAMLLPGISGSYLLTILGAYGMVIQALADFIQGVATFIFDDEAFFILANMLLGIMIGALVFSHVVSWLLRSYHDLSIAALTGFMVGALRSVWPFWSYSYVLLPFKLEKGPQLKIADPILPDFTSVLFFQSIGFAILGFGLVLILERIANRKLHRS
jgi:putative membrane protein